MSRYHPSTVTRWAGSLVVACAMTVTAPAVLADGGRDPKPSTQSVKSTSQPTTQRAARTQRPSQQQATSRASSTQRRATTTRQTARSTTPRVVETAPSGVPPEGEARFITDEVIVRFQLSSTERGRNRAINRLGLAHLEVQTVFLAGVTVHRYRLPAGLDVRDAITRLEASAAVVNAQPNYLYTLQQSDSAEKLPQFGNARIGLSAAHEQSKGGGVRIAVIDTAVDGAHPELAEARLTAVDVSDGGGNVDPHGTSLAGILAADAKLTGVAPQAEILSIAAFAQDASGQTTGNTWSISEALNVAHKQKAHILNMSFAGPADPLLARAMKGAVTRNVLPIAAAGNEGADAAPLFPAAYEEVIAVTATDSEDKVYSNANTGDHVDLAAPGVGLLVLSTGSGFRTSSGTSISTAYVSGIAALVLAANPGSDIAKVRALLDASATDLGPPGKDQIFGAGLPDAATAISGLTN